MASGHRIVTHSSYCELDDLILNLHPVAQAMAYVAYAMGVAMVAPQIHRIVHRPHLRGGFLAFAIGQTGMWPQVYETVWRRRGLGPSSLSVLSSILTVLSQLLWLIFAVLTVDAPVMVAAIVTITTAEIITVVEVSRRRAPIRSEREGVELAWDAALVRTGTGIESLHCASGAHGRCSLSLLHLCTRQFAANRLLSYGDHYFVDRRSGRPRPHPGGR